MRDGRKRELLRKDERKPRVEEFSETVLLQKTLHVIGVFPCLYIVLRTVVEENVLFPSGGHGVEKIHQLRVCEVTAIESFLEPVSEVLLCTGLR